MKNSFLPQAELTKLDVTIKSQLKTAGVTLCSGPPFTNSENLYEIKESFEKDMLSMHPLTIKEFYVNCLTPLSQIISSKGSLPKEYAVLVVMVTGYAEAVSKVNNEALLKPSIYLKQMQSAFSELDILEIETEAKNLMYKFHDQVKSCKDDFVRDRTKDQKGEELVNKLQALIVSDNGLEKVLEAVKGTESIDVLSSVYLKQQRDELLGSPLDRLIFTLSKLFLYWEVLHHCGYINLSDSKNVQSMNWQQFL
jgi:hypothetical protein